MPGVEYFPFLGPNRRSDKTVVEIRLFFSANDRHAVRPAEIRQLLIDGGVLDANDGFPEQALPDDWMSAYASLLAQTALVLQQRTGHRVNFFSVDSEPAQDRSIVLVEHEHCDVGMTAVKLALELVSGQRRMLREPFLMFKKFAGERLLPYQTEAIISLARQRDIPVVHLERAPYERLAFDSLTGGKCRCPNGLLILGHGRYQHALDGTWSLDLQEDLLGDAEDSNQAAEQILERLFPAGQPARMPIIAITGTNGKTTTTRMVNHIAQWAGRKPGMVCTDGIFLDGRQVTDVDQSTRSGHLRVLTSREADIAILETHHAGIMGRGFAFRWCDIAICLNVAEDHLGVAGVDSVEQMAPIKRALIERARYAAILNADDPHCRTMLDAVTAEKTCLVSMALNPAELQEMAAAKTACCCVLEPVAGEQWLVIHDEGERLPVMAVGQIPATFGGAARFNISNAMHAVAAAHLAGFALDVIGSAMATFDNSYRNTPGRLNIFDQLPFRIVMDFAHNPHGMEKLCEFTDQLEVRGRKLLAFSGSVDRTDESIRELGRVVAGHFDFYFCKEYVYSKGEAPRTTAHLVRQGLLQAGVAPEQTLVRGNGKDVIFEIFDTCKPGDLLVMLLGHVEKHQLPAYIEEYASRSNGPSATGKLR